MAQEPRPSDKTLRLQMSETQAKLGVNSRTDNASARIFARGERLSPLLVGAVAINGTGKLIGVVEGVTNEGARIIPGDELEAAVRRVLTRRTSVPQPWLGAQGQDLTGVKLKSLIENGWHEADAQRLLANFRGVMLTNVLPYTPAAFADLRPGDIVTRIGEHPVRGVDDFSKLLAEAGSGAKVRFTISRAERREQQMFVQLGESLNPLRETERAQRLERLAEVGDSIAHLLMPLGLEIITAPAKLRARLGAEEGLLVVSLRTGGIAAVSGLREGDIIERVNGRLLTEADADSILASTNRTEVTFDIVRTGQRINLMMIYPPSIEK
jgi:S1-C subfamily serine protease